MLTEYIEAAMTHAEVEWDAEGQQFIGDIPVCEGVISVGSNETECREELREALEEWIVLRLWRNWELPEIDGHSVSVARVA